MLDIVIPNNNEKEFILIAEKLGYSSLLFLYDFAEYSEKKEQKLETRIKINYGILANQQNIQKINDKLRNKRKFIAIKSSSVDREVIEKGHAGLIFSLEEKTTKDFMHQRGSGMDHVMAKLAKNNGIIVGFSISSIINSSNKNLILGRMMQNIKLCRKFKVKTITASFAQSPMEMRSPYDLKSLFNLLRMEKRYKTKKI